MVERVDFAINRQLAQSAGYQLSELAAEIYDKQGLGGFCGHGGVYTDMGGRVNVFSC